MLILAFLALAGQRAAGPAHADNPDLGGFWQTTTTSNYPGSTTGYCSTTITPGSINNFSGTGSCTSAGLSTVNGTLAEDGVTVNWTGTLSLPVPWTTSGTGTFDPETFTLTGTWMCTSGLGSVCATLNGTTVSTRLAPPPSLDFPGTFTGADGTTISFAQFGTYEWAPESLTSGDPPPAGMSYAHYAAYRFSPSQTFSPCISGAPAQVPYNGAGYGGPLLTFHVPAAQVNPLALPISVFVFNPDTAQWENVGAANQPDGSGGYDVAAIVCHFSLYAAFGSAPLAIDSDGDGCNDQQEIGADHMLGGLRNPLNPWDFYDVAGMGNGPPDGVVDLANDILGVILHYSPTGAAPYDAAFDRGPSPGPNTWNMTAPDGVIDLANDILGVILQYLHSCQ